MGQERQSEIERRVAEGRRRRRWATLCDGLSALLGTRQQIPLPEESHRATLVASYHTGHRSAVDHEWSLCRATFADAERVRIVALLARIMAAVGDRPCWLFLAHQPTEVVSTSTADVLDNPMGFAALDDYQIRLGDQNQVSGMWLARHGHHYGPKIVEYTWELEVWGEPLISASKAAVRTVTDPQDLV